MARGEWHALADDLVRQIMRHYHIGLRKRMAERRLSATRKRKVQHELTHMFDFANGEVAIVFMLLSVAPYVLVS
jgi:hypothetical protein